MTDLGPLFHWSPRDRLKSITRSGLLPGKRNVLGPRYHGTADNMNLENEDIGAGEYRQESVSFSLDPATAWAYSHGAWKTTGEFDLWQVFLIDSDEVHVSPGWGSRINEVRVHNRIPKSRLIWIGERTVLEKTPKSVN